MADPVHLPIQCCLEKLSGSRSDGLRTNRVDGACGGLPVPGESFVMTGVPIDKQANMRVIKTSPVKTVEWMDTNSCSFYTENSLYKFTLLDKQAAIQ